MWGNVFSPLNRQNNDRTVDAKGWMQWDTGETSAVFTIGITQGIVSGTGSGPYQNGKTTWDIRVAAANNQQFQRGPANASVTAVVTHSDGSTTTVNWTTVVQLN
jgi:hypothetical protein